MIPAGLALFQLSGQQSGAVGVQLALHRAVFFLSRVQRGLRGHILLLAGGGGLLGPVGIGQALQKLLAVSRKPLRQLNAVVGFQQIGLGLAQRGAVGLVFGNALLHVRRALFQIGHNDVGLVRHIGGALFLGNQCGQLAAAGGALFGNFQSGVTAGNLLVQFLHHAGLTLLVDLIGLQQQPGQLGSGTGGKGVALGLYFLQVCGGCLVRTLAQQCAHVHQKYIIQTFTFLVRLAGVLLRGLSQTLVVCRVKNAAQDSGTLGGGRVEQLGKIVLRQHRHLCKLLGVNAQQLDHCIGHGRGTADGLVRLTDELSLGGHLDHTAAALGGTLLVGPAAHGVGAPAVGKGQLHRSFHVRRRKIAAQHRCFSVLAGSLAIEGEGDGIKQGGLARAGIAANNEQPIAAEGCKVQLGVRGIRAEGVQNQLLGFHSVFDASSRNFFTASTSSVVSGRPFILVKKSWNNSAKGLPFTAWVISAGRAAAPRGW